MSYEDHLDVLDTDRAKGFPLVMLPRDPTCHFWTGKGCRVYQGRPLACRMCPLGRGVRPWEIAPCPAIGERMQRHRILAE